MLDKRARYMLYAAVSVASASFLYVYVIEPRLEFLAMPEAAYARYKKDAALLERKNGIQERLKEISGSGYWKKAPEEQQVEMQRYLEELGRASGISEFISIRPSGIREDPPFREVSVQMDARLPLASAVQFLYRAGTGPFPLRIEKLQIYSEENDPRRIRMQVIVASLWMPAGEYP